MFLLANVHNKIGEYEKTIADQCKDQVYTKINKEKLLYQLLKENEYLRNLSHSSNLIGESKRLETAENEFDKNKTRQSILLNQMGINEDEKVNNNMKTEEYQMIDKETIDTNGTSEIKEILREYKNMKKGKTRIKPPPPLTNQAIVNKVENLTTIQNTGDNYLSKKLDYSQTNIKPRQQYLFFKTPKENDKKKFDFSQEQINCLNVDNQIEKIN